MPIINGKRILTVRELLAELEMQREDDLVLFSHKYASDLPFTAEYKMPDMLDNVYVTSELWVQNPDQISEYPETTWYPAIRINLENGL